MALVRVYREGDSWGLIRRYATDMYSFDDIPSPIKEKLPLTGFKKGSSRGHYRFFQDYHTIFPTIIY